MPASERAIMPAGSRSAGNNRTARVLVCMNPNPSSTKNSTYTQMGVFERIWTIKVIPEKCY
jgi:hypothetical protein